MTEDDPCRAEREALAQAALEYGNIPQPELSADGSEDKAEANEKAREAAARIEQKLMAAQAAFDECEQKNAAVAEGGDEG